MEARTTLRKAVASASGTALEVRRAGSWREGGCEVGEARVSWDPTRRCWDPHQFHPPANTPPTGHECPAGEAGALCRRAALLAQDPEKPKEEIQWGPRKLKPGSQGE